MIYLYVKTHKKTGLRYLGKTKNKNPEKYPGSGKYWKRHLSKHGNDVSTNILLESEDKEEIRKWGKYYSDLWNVVESKGWANLVEECGDGGDTSSTEAYKEGMKRRIHKSPEVHPKPTLGKVWYTDGKDNILLDDKKDTIPENFYKGRVLGPNKIKKTKKESGWNHSEESKLKMSKSAEKRIEKYGTPKGAFQKGNIPHNKGKSMNEEERKRLSESLQNQPKISCEHCGKETTKGNYSRWHGRNCKYGK